MALTEFIGESLSHCKSLYFFRHQVGKELNFNTKILIRMFILQGKSEETSAVVRVYVEESFSTFNEVRYHSNRNLQLFFNA